MYELAILTIFPAAVIFAAFTDLFTMTIPNRISLVLVAGFISLLPFSGLSLADIGWHFAAGALMLAITMGMFFAGVVGGGDAKLVSAVALWVGLDLLLPYLLMASIFGGALTLILLFIRKYPLLLAVSHASWLERLHQTRGPIPYGIALSAAALWVYPQTSWCASLFA